MNNVISGATAPTTSSVQTLIQVANRAKTIVGGFGGDYVLADVIFAVLLGRFFNRRGADKEGLTLFLETNDPTGEKYDETYYDLVVLKSGEDSLSIPLPRLSPQTVAAVFKNKTAVTMVVERNAHNRVYEEPESGEIDSLWEMFGQIVYSPFFFGFPTEETDFHLARTIWQFLNDWPCPEDGHQYPVMEELWKLTPDGETEDE